MTPSIPVSRDQKVCGTSAPGPVSATTTGLGNAVVWIADAKTGKPQPIEKRMELVSEDCRLDPRVQGAVTGSTFDVYNDDKVIHRLVFGHAGAHDTLTVIPFFNAGQVVASERLAKHQGLVEVQCARHPWMRAYIAVFDHPYFAVTRADGTFRIDSLPAGRYKMMVWHEGAATPVEQSIAVQAGGEVKADVSIKLAAK